MKKVQTLCIVLEPPRILLGMKKRGFGAGRWNGFGGNVLPDEAIEAAARREVFEEAGIRVGAVEKMGVILFEFQGKPDTPEVHIFKTGEFTGEPAESEEMKPQWFVVDQIPYSEMWVDDKYWLPLLLQGKKFKGCFLFGEGGKILKQELKEL